MENPLIKLADDMMTEAEQGMAEIKVGEDAKCDFCADKMEEYDYELGHQYTDGRWACQKCFENSQDVIE